MSKSSGTYLALWCLLVPQHAQKGCCFVQLSAVSNKSGGQTTKTLMGWEIGSQLAKTYEYVQFLALVESAQFGGRPVSCDGE